MTAKLPHPVTTSRRQLLLALASTATLSACGGGSGGTPAPTPTPTPPPTPPTPPILNGSPWWGHGRDAQHGAQAATATQTLSRVQWSTPVDLQPQYTGSGSLLIHYGSPVATAKNTIIIPVKTGAAGGFRVEGRAGGSGALLWTVNSDYVLPPHRWIPSYGATLAPSNRLYVPGAGGKLLWRDDADAASAALQTTVFYGAGVYNAAAAACDASIFINTPLTTDTNGTLFFGFVANSGNPAGLVSGLARVAADGTGTWVAAAAASGDPAIAKIAMNCAPALSADMKTVYVACNIALVTGVRQTGYLLALDSTTLATKGVKRLLDPSTGVEARVSDDSTSSVTVSPNGDVFYGVLEADVRGHNGRGWLLHFDATLAQTKIPGSFGWDTTASLMPASMVPSYTGPSTYLLMTKYNNYGGAGTGDGRNSVAVLDPDQSQPDSVAAIPVMREILVKVAPSPDPLFPGGVKEWCINTAAVDPLTKSVLVNNEDGYLYRWDMASNSFTERVQLTSGLGQAYTPTTIGADGAVFAISNARLFSVGR